MTSPAGAPREPRRDDLAPEFRCPCCGKGAPRTGSHLCASCGKRICPACLRVYGHHMLVCEDCRLAEW
jgi:hypothetical protein